MVKPKYEATRPLGRFKEAALPVIEAASGDSGYAAYEDYRKIFGEFEDYLVVFELSKRIYSFVRPSPFTS